jgi:adiponectin receptor
MPSYFVQPRVVTTSYSFSVASITKIHTETINIWSHLLGTTWFIFEAIQFSKISENSIIPSDLVVQMYLTSAVICLLCSTLYHTFSDHVHARLWQQFDHCGIVIFIWASAVSFTYLAFDGERCKQWVYVTLLTFSALISMFLLLTVSYTHLRGRRYRMTIHTVFGSFATLPAFHYCCFRSRGIHDTELLRAFWSLVVMNCIGGGVYATRLFERAFGEWVNMLDMSHYTMHGTVVYGAWIYYCGLLKKHEQLQQARCLTRPY